MPSPFGSAVVCSSPQGQPGSCLLALSFFHPGWHFLLLLVFKKVKIARSHLGSQVLILTIPSERNEKAHSSCRFGWWKRTPLECWLYKIISLKVRKRCPERIPGPDRDETEQPLVFFHFSKFLELCANVSKYSRVLNMPNQSSVF